MRPRSITILCIILFVLGGLNLVSCGFSFFSASLGRALWSLATTLISLASFVGLWAMRRWAPVLYLGGFAVGTITFFMVPPEGASVMTARLVFWIMLLAVPAIYCVVVLPHWSKLR
jgi:hypothetical protein